MAKFCTKCGRELVEGISCGCENMEKVRKDNHDISSLMKEFLEVTKKMFNKPIDTLKENTKESKFNLAIISLLSLVITMGLFVFVLIKEYMVQTTFGFLNLTSSIDVPFFKIFISAGVTAALYIVLLSCITYIIVDKLMNQKTSLKKIFTMYSLSSIILSTFLLFGVITIYINPALAVMIVCAGSMLNMYYNYKGLENSIKVDVNKIGYILVASIMANTFIFQLIISKIFN